MPRKSRVGGVLPEIALDAHAPEPLYRQLYEGLRDRIVRGDLTPGARLASSRTFASELGVSRFTLMTAFDELRADGYLEARRGGGTYVARNLPDRHLVSPRAPAPAIRPAGLPRVEPRLSDRGRLLSALPITGPRAETGEPLPFRPRRPPLDAFPFSVWARIVRKQWSRFRHDLLDYGDPAGYAPLRSAIAAHLGATRGLTCSPEQIIITSGSQQAFDIVFRSLLDPGDEMWVEEPGSLDARGPLVASGATLVPVPVDADGIDVAEGIRRAPRARLACVSPSHQYPTGSTLSAARREALLDWADSVGAWIVEDDYDSYFRYSGKAIRALQTLDQGRAAATGATQRVMYVGTFSKTMFPSLRLGYCVVPPSFAGTFANARAVADRNSPLADQAALAEFMRGGHYDRHLRRVRAVCLERYEALRVHIAKHCGSSLELGRANAGTHVLGWVQDADAPGRAQRISAACAAEGMVVFALSRYCLRPPARDALVLGYGGLTPERIARGAARLAGIIERTR